MKYIVVELQTDANGNVANIVTAKDTKNEAESVYHSVLAAAALSDLPCHAATLMTNEGQVLKYQCYKNDDSEYWEGDVE